MGLLVLQWSAEYLQDETHLYIAVDVTDERQISKQENAWTQGGLELRIDGRADPDRSQGRGEAGDALDILISPDHVPENMILYQAQTLEQARVVAIGVPTPTGHVYEVFRPPRLHRVPSGAGLGGHSPSCGGNRTGGVRPTFPDPALSVGQVSRRER